MEFTFDDFKSLDDIDNILADELSILNIETSKKKFKSKKKQKNKYKTKYDIHTMEYYKSLRKQKMDPIIGDILDDKCFKFYNMWDPYTGERTEIDPYGPLCFHPDYLIKHFYTQRLNKLWVSPSDESGGYYQGQYDDCVGIGDDFYLNGRNEHNPQWYVFRLPIIDCYLTDDHHTQLITMGPILTDQEIAEIEECALSYYKNNYTNMFRNTRPSVVHMKQQYDIAISKNPLLDSCEMEENTISNDERHAINNKLNRDAVDSLVYMKG